MGAYVSQITQAQTSLEGNRLHRKAKQVLNKAKSKSAPHKVLVLGPRGSGKSTIVKQLQFSKDVPFSPQEIENYRRLIFNNLKFGLQYLLDAMIGMQLEVAENNVRHIEAIAEVVVLSDGEPFPVSFLEPLKSLWADGNVQMAYSRGNEEAPLGFPEMLHHYFSDLERLFDPHYIPSALDILYCKVPTIGITETRFSIYSIEEVLIAEVGHYTTGLPRWIHYFQDAGIILFLVNLSAYDQSLVEDRDTNKMQDTMAIWDSICHSPWFRSTSLALLLNKYDLFEEKIRHSPIKRFFPDYEGEPGDPRAGCEYFGRSFFLLARKADTAERESYLNVTTATDTASMRAVWETIHKDILSKALRLENIL